MYLVLVNSFIINLLMEKYSHDEDHSEEEDLKSISSFNFVLYWVLWCGIALLIIACLIYLLIIIFLFTAMLIQEYII